jgi:hypothetical protein
MEKIAQLFPNCITEALDAYGKSKLSVDFDKLRQELSDEVVEGRDERYQFVWPDKKKAILLANSPINATSVLVVKVALTSIIPRTYTSREIILMCSSVSRRLIWVR